MRKAEVYQKTRELLYKSMVSGHIEEGNIEYHFTMPSPGRYPFQFFWDTCLHVFILTALEEHEMAKKHLYSLFAMQEEDGFVGHMIYWDRIMPGRLTDVFQSRLSQGIKLVKPHMSALIQPPLVAQAVERVYRKTSDRRFLEYMFPKLKRYYEWLAKNRDFEGNGLLTIISPFESGMDWKPSYDEVLGLKRKQADWRLFYKEVSVDFRNFINNYNLRKIYHKGYFLVKGAGFNTIYAQNLGSMAFMADELQDSSAQHFRGLSKKVSVGILNLMYDDKDAAFYDLYGKKNSKIKVLTPTIFYPIVLKDVPDEVALKVMEKHFFNKEEFNLPYPLPSAAKSEPSFNPNASIYIWRGPTWIVNNWFMHQYLMEKGYDDAAKKMINSVLSLIGKSGFREYYNPFNGAGYGAKNFTWAGLVSDMISMQERASTKKI